MLDLPIFATTMIVMKNIISRLANW